MGGKSESRTAIRANSELKEREPGKDWAKKDWARKVWAKKDWAKGCVGGWGVSQAPHDPLPLTSAY